MEPKFEIIYDHKEFVLIEDQAGREVRPSVTNSVEWVVGWLLREDKMHEPQRLFYIDSFEEMDEIQWNIHDGFKTFKHPDFHKDLIAHEVLVQWLAIKLKRKKE